MIDWNGRIRTVTHRACVQPCDAMLGEAPNLHPCVTGV